VLCDRSLKQKLNVFLAHLIFQWKINGQIPWATAQLEAVSSCPDIDEVTKANATAVLYLIRVSHLNEATILDPSFSKESYPTLNKIKLDCIIKTSNSRWVATN
jgi:hypothetical protein